MCKKILAIIIVFVLPLSLLVVWDALASGYDYPLYEASDGKNDYYGHLYETIDNFTWEMNGYDGTGFPGSGFARTSFHNQITQTVNFNFTTERRATAHIGVRVQIVDQLGNEVFDQTFSAPTSPITHTFSYTFFPQTGYDISFSGTKVDFYDLQIDPLSYNYATLYNCGEQDTFDIDDEGWNYGDEVHVDIGHVLTGSIQFSGGAGGSLEKTFTGINCDGFYFWLRGYGSNTFYVTINSVDVYTGSVTIGRWGRHIIQHAVSGVADIAIRFDGIRPSCGTVLFDDVGFFEPAPTPTPTNTPEPTTTLEPTSTPTPTPVITPQPTPTPQPPPPPQPGEGSGVDATCYECNLPSGVQIIYLSNWINWLGCLLNNLFWCVLYVWLLELGNTIMGVYNYFAALINWLSVAVDLLGLWWQGVVDGVIDWFNGMLTSWWAAIQVWFFSLVVNLLMSDIIQYVWSTYQFVVGLLAEIIEQFRWFGSILSGFGERVSIVVDLVSTFIQAIKSGFEVEPADMSEILFGEPNSENTSYYLIVISLAAVDSILGQYFMLSAITAIVLGILSIGLIAWTFKEFQDILPI